MKSKKLLVALAVLGMTGFSGCSICCGPYDYDYPTFGGLKQRVDRRHGRVGSVFSDPSITSGYSEVVSQQPTPAPENSEENGGAADSGGILPMTPQQ